jgi:PAS domain S-box-containing protein
MEQRYKDERLGEADYRLMIDSVTDTEIIMLDRDGCIRSWNRGGQKLKGYTADEVIGRPVTIFYTDEDRTSGLMQHELATAAAEGRFEFEGWRVRKDGRKFWANIVLQPMTTPEGQLFGFVKVTRDLTEHLRSEAGEKFRAVVEASPAAMVMVNKEGRIVLINAQAEKLFGYERDEMMGKGIDMLVPERYRDAHPQQRNGFLAQPRARMMGMGRDLYCLRKDGTEVPVEIGLNPIETVEGRCVLAAIVNITERIEREQLLQRQRDEILELSTPVIQVWEKILALPIIGTLDSQRAARLTENLLQKIAMEQAEFVILDISGVPTIDSQVAKNLLKTVQGARLMGAESIISGVRPETAQAMVHLGIDIGTLRSRATLRDALQLALKLRRDALEKTKAEWSAAG